MCNKPGMSIITEHRKRAGLTQSAFAERVGVSQSFLSEIEAGTKRPGLRVAIAIARETGGAVPVEAWASWVPSATAAPNAEAAE